LLGRPEGNDEHPVSTCACGQTSEPGGNSGATRLTFQSLLVT